MNKSDTVKMVEQIYAKKDDLGDTAKETKRSNAYVSLMDRQLNLSIKTIFFTVVLALLVSGSFLTGRYVFPSTDQDGLFAAAISGFWNTPTIVSRAVGCSNA